MTKATRNKKPDRRRLPRPSRGKKVLLEKAPPSGSAKSVGELQNRVRALKAYQTGLERENHGLRRARLELESSRTRLARLHKLAPVGYLSLDAKGIIREANQTAARLLGMERRTLVHQPLARFIAADSLDKYHLHRRQVLTSATQQTCKLQMRRPNGASFVARLNGIVEPSARNKSPDSLLALIDVTRQSQAETALRESQAQLAGIIRSAMDAIITVNSRQRIILCNQAAEEMFGRATGKLIGQRLDELIPKAARRAHNEHVRRFGATGVTSRRMGHMGRILGLHADGTEFPVEASISQSEIDGEKLFTVILRDITHRLKAEDLLRSEKEFSESLIATAPVAVLVLDPNGRILQFNPCLAAITGHRPEEVQGRDWFRTFLPQGDRTRIRKVFGRALKGSHTRGNVNPILTKDGQLRNIEWFNTLLKGPDGSVTGLLAIGTDVTERLRIEEELRRSEGMLADFFAEAPVGLLWADRNGRILRVNRTQLEMLGHTGEEVFGRSIAEFYLDAGAAAHALDQLGRKKTLHNHRAIFRNKDGSLRHVLIDANGLWERGRLSHSRWFVRDISWRVELEREILRISELEQSRLGQELHDDVCQQLTAIEFLAHGLEQSLSAQSSPDSRRAAEISRMLREANTHVRELSHDLARLELEPGGLIGELEGLAQRTRRVFRRDCQVRCGRGLTFEDPQMQLHLYRIAQEAVNNAIKHGRAKRIEIRLEKCGERVVLGIHDNGVGIARSPRPGSGMGLRLMQYRAGLICGSLAVQREPGGGTSVVCSVHLGSTDPKGGPRK